MICLQFLTSLRSNVHSYVVRAWLIFRPIPSIHIPVISWLLLAPRESCAINCIFRFHWYGVVFSIIMGPSISMVQARWSPISMLRFGCYFFKHSRSVSMIVLDVGKFCSVAIFKTIILLASDSKDII